MSSRVFQLAALIPPGSVEAEVNSVQEEILRARGLASAHALPPLVPIAFTAAQERPRALLRELDRIVCAPWRMTLKAAAWIEGYLYLGIDSAGAWHALRGHVPVASPQRPEELFPPAEGFFLGCGDAAADEREAIRVPASGTSFSSCAVALVRIETRGSPEAWWRELYWEIIDQVPLRGSRPR